MTKPMKINRRLISYYSLNLIYNLISEFKNRNDCDHLFLKMYQIRFKYYVKALNIGIIIFPPSFRFYHNGVPLIVVKLQYRVHAFDGIIVS